MKNVALFEAVRKVFGEVPTIVNEGGYPLIRIKLRAPSLLQEQLTVLDASECSGGEQYAVCCPFCGDRRKRLYISHLWSSIITVGGLQYRCSDHLVRCFNEECMKDEGKFRSVVDKLHEALTIALKGPVIMSMRDTPDVEEYSGMASVGNQVNFPSNALEVDSLLVPANIRKYVEERGWDCDILKSQGVKVARWGQFKNPMLIFTVMQYGEYWFWQGRMVPVDGTINGMLELDQMGQQVKKYYIPSGAKKSWALYNLDEAVNHDVVCIVEGVTDVWAIGDNAVARFGKRMSTAQRQVLKSRFRGKTIIIVPDMNDAEAVTMAEEEAIELESTKLFSSVAVAYLPEGRDPGSFQKDGKEVLWKIIKENMRSPGGSYSGKSGTLLDL